MRMIEDPNAQKDRECLARGGTPQPGGTCLERQQHTAAPRPAAAPNGCEGNRLYKAVATPADILRELTEDEPSRDMLCVDRREFALFLWRAGLGNNTLAGAASAIRGMRLDDCVASSFTADMRRWGRSLGGVAEPQSTIATCPQRQVYVVNDKPILAGGYGYSVQRFPY